MTSLLALLVLGSMLLCMRGPRAPWAWTFKNYFISVHRLQGYDFYSLLVMLVLKCVKIEKC